MTTKEDPSPRFPPCPAWQTVDLGGPVSYREWPGPDGPTFVCVHGLGGSVTNWMCVAPELASRGRVLAVDLVGFGGTPRLGRSARMSANRHVLSAYIQRVAAPPVVLVGDSMGAA